MIYKQQISIYNSLQLGTIQSTENRQLFDSWCYWIREELIGVVFEAERIHLIAKILNTYEFNTLGFIDFFKTTLQPKQIN